VIRVSSGYVRITQSLLMADSDRLTLQSRKLRLVSEILVCRGYVARKISQVIQQKKIEVAE